MKLLGKERLFLHPFSPKQQYQIERALIFIVVILSALVFGIISVVNHQRFLTFGWDLGVYDQVAWMYSKFRFPYSTFVRMPTLGNHFSPIIALFAPFYWLFPDAKVLLIGQAILAAAAAYPIFLLGKLLTKSAYVGFASAISYLTFIGLQRAVFFDFHTDTILPFSIALVLLFAHKKKENLSLLFSFILLLHKEWAGLLVASIGIMYLFHGKRSLAVKTILLGVVGFVITIYGVIIPLGGRDSPLFGYGQLGHTPDEVLINSIRRPWIPIKMMLDPQEKVVTMFNSLLPFAFLPIASPSTLIPIVEQFASRFLDYGHQQRWTLRFHYSAPLAPLLAYGAIMGIKRLKSIWPAHLLLATSLVGIFVFHAPVLTIFKPHFYFEHSWIQDTREVLKKVPKRVSVAAQNNLVPHLSSRENIYPLPIIADAEYVVVDFHHNQSDYNFHTGTMEEIKKQIRGLLNSGTFSIVFQRGDAMVLKRNFLD